MLIFLVMGRAFDLLRMIQICELIAILVFINIKVQLRKHQPVSLIKKNWNGAPFCNVNDKSMTQCHCQFKYFQVT